MQEARLFGPAIFQAAKLRVLTLGRESKKGPSEVVEPPRVYTVTHSDLTAHLTLAIAREINKTQVQMEVYYKMSCLVFHVLRFGTCYQFR